MIRLAKKEIAARAEPLAKRIAVLPGFTVALRDGESVIGGGSTPGQTLATLLIAVRHAQHSASMLEETFRRGKPAILGRVEQGEFVLDLRTVDEDQDDRISQAFGRI
jgi:L-seryl-tRNA(Ser) seleniumtransferase